MALKSSIPGSPCGSPRAAGLLLCLLITGCTPFPELEARISPEARRAPYPALLPMDALLARRGTDRLAPEAADEMKARVARLRARARALAARPVLTAAERARLLSALSRFRG